MDIAGESSGTDRTSVRGVGAARCVQGACVIGEYLAGALSLAVRSE